MKRALYVLAIICILVFSAAEVSAVQVSWRIKQHKNPKSFKSEVTEMAKSGYLPMGISFKDGGFYVLYLKGGNLKISAWSLESYKDVDAFKSGVTGKMNEGYIPSGISHTGKLFFVLFIKTPNSAVAWQLVNSDPAPESIKASISKYTKDWYFPVGITSYGGQYYTLLIKTKKTDIKSWRIGTYEPTEEALTGGINQAINEGYLPWGFDFSGERIQVLYAGLVPYKE